MDKEIEIPKRENPSEEKLKYEHDEEQFPIEYNSDGFDAFQSENEKTKTRRSPEKDNKEKHKQSKFASQPEKKSKKPENEKKEEYQSKYEKSYKEKEKSKPKEEEVRKSEKQRIDRERDRGEREQKNLYHESDESEFCVHFYIENVYLSPNRSVPEFLAMIRERVKKAGQSEHVQIVYLVNNSEVKLSIGMKYDQDAIDILSHKRTIYLYNKDQKLYETKPIISNSFEIYLNHIKKKPLEKKNEKESKKYEQRSSYSRSYERSNRKKSPSYPRKKENDSYIRKQSNFDKKISNKSKSGSSHSMKNRDDSNLKRKISSKFRAKSPLIKSRKARDTSSSDSYSKNLRSRSRNREKRVSKNFGEKPKVATVQNLTTQPPAQNFNQSGNMPIVDNNSSELINMAFLLNQQMANPQGLSLNEYILPAATNKITVEEKNIKETKEVTNTIVSSENVNVNAENIVEANVNTSFPASKSKNFTITNNDNKKIINFNHRKKDTPNPVVIPVNQDINDCICFLLGIPQTYAIGDVINAIKQMNTEIEKTVKSKEELEKFYIDSPVEFHWETINEMEYLKLIFPNTKSAENLIVNSLKIYQNSVIVLPYLPNKPLIDLLEYHELSVHTSKKVNEHIIFQNFIIYGDIVNVIDQTPPNSHSGTYIIVYAHHLSVKRLNLNPSLKCQITVENFDVIDIIIQMIDKPIIVKRPPLEETINSKFNFNEAYAFYNNDSKKKEAIAPKKDEIAVKETKKDSEPIKDVRESPKKEKDRERDRERSNEGKKKTSKNDYSHSPPSFHYNKNYRNNSQNYRYNNNYKNNNYSRDNNNRDNRDNRDRDNRDNRDSGYNRGYQNQNSNYRDYKYNNRDKYNDNNRNYSQNKRNNY